MTRQDELSKLQTKHQLILDAAGEGVYGLDRDGNVTFSNAAATEILGWKGEDVLGQRSHDVHHHSYPDGSNYPRDDCPIYAALKDGEVHTVDCEVFWHANGTAVQVEYTSTPILVDGKPDGAVVIFKDISERRRIEQEREEAYAEIKLLKEQLENERNYLRDEIDVTANFGEIVGHSLALKRTLAKVEAVADTSANVLVLGESGVGKEMIARAIHSNSERCDKALVKVNCASIPKDLFESEFFGHVRGAFTGAHKDRVGRLQLANGGTLFLDEVGEIPISLQGKLLRALQEQEFERVGDEETTKVDVRVVAATNRDLEGEVAAGRFREDLFYRINVIELHVPPLRERSDDVLMLAHHVLQKLARNQDVPVSSLTKDAKSALLTYRFPGNVRELENILERALTLSSDDTIDVDDIQLRPQTEKDLPAVDEGGTLGSQLEDIERDAIVKALEQTRYNKTAAAKLLGISFRALRYRIKKLEIE